jgi:predicted RNA-binding Zn ribbon-like protein
VRSRAKSGFEYTGGNLCLDFANTIEDRGSEHPVDLWSDYSRLLLWAEESGALSQNAARQLSSLARESPASAQSALALAGQLRDAVYDVFSAMVQQRKIPDQALATLNKAVQRSAKHAQVVARNRRFQWEWILPEGSLDSMLWPVARAAADLLTSDDLLRIRQCASPACSWLFLDRSKNRRRRWCDMRICGNQDKARRYYYRQKTG